MNNSNRKVFLGTMRIPFLTLPPVCVALGAATAVYTGHALNWFYLALIFIGAISVHISVNVLNEYFDFKSGLDLRTKPTPFSGGSGTLPNHPDKAGLALLSGLIWLAVGIGIGIYFMTVRGLWIVPLGILGILVIILYTNFITRRPLLCLIAPGLGFGPLMVIGTDFILTGSYSWTAFMASLVPFFLVNNLLLLNQFPDVEADEAAGRKHFPITIGRKASARLFATFLFAVYVSIAVGYLYDFLPLAGFLAFISIALAVPTIKGALTYAEDIPKLMPAMGKNVIINLSTPILLAIGLSVS